MRAVSRSVLIDAIQYFPLDYFVDNPDLSSLAKMIVACANDMQSR